MMFVHAPIIISWIDSNWARAANGMRKSVEYNRRGFPLNYEMAKNNGEKKYNMICFRLFPFVCLTFVRTLRFAAWSKFRLFIGLVCVIVARANSFLFFRSYSTQPHTKLSIAAAAAPAALPSALLLRCVRAKSRPFCITFTLTRYFTMLPYTFPTPFCVTLLNGFLTQNKRKTFNATFLVLLCSISREPMMEERRMCGFRAFSHSFASLPLALVRDRIATIFLSPSLSLCVCFILFTLFYCLVMSLFI